MAELDVESLIPEEFRWILDHDWLDDGDTYVLGGGMLLEYDGRGNRFALTRRGELLGHVPRGQFAANGVRRPKSQSGRGY